MDCLRRSLVDIRHQCPGNPSQVFRDFFSLLGGPFGNQVCEVCAPGVDESRQHVASCRCELMGTRAARIRATDESVLLQLLQQRCHSLDLNPVLCGKTIEIDLWIPLDPNEQPRGTGAEREAGVADYGAQLHSRGHNRRAPHRSQRRKRSDLLLKSPGWFRHGRPLCVNSSEPAFFVVCSVE
jgi:hypothetical protein